MMTRCLRLSTFLAVLLVAGCTESTPSSRQMSEAEQMNWQAVHLRWWEMTCPNKDWSPLYYKFRVVESDNFEYRHVADESYGELLLVGKRYLGDRQVVSAGFAEFCGEGEV